ncbi:hypothetical protein E0H75_30555 [Kribbella capetownensis]|uniref:Uncharacterized protein n=1 Tax=Kribbella capetownensis TaxID=1572659 RepID=A0A4R0JGP0_9ACTN|nr:hypothetical protein [Kribbella capetownensis]TCC46041.1 hypothetical protein E0H75_30555 [Kribbella capetownensis]
MTSELKDLMTEATDREAPYVPNVDGLLRAGRRDVRKRRIMASIAAAAAVVVIAGATTVAVDARERSSTPPAAPATTQGQRPAKLVVPAGGSTGLCTKSNGDTVSAWSWPVVVDVRDTFGMSVVRRSPADPKVVAFCTTEWGNGAGESVVPGGSVQGVVLRKSAAEGRGVTGPASVTTVFGVVQGTPKVTVQTDDGHVGVATVKNGFYAYRRVELSPWPGPIPGAVVKFRYPGQGEYVAAHR